MDPSSAIDLVIDRFVRQHGLSPAAAMGVLRRAATRKRVTPAVLAVRIVSGVEDPYREIDHLRVALASRDVIGQAKGILMERHGIGSDEAFARLVEMSQHSNVKLRDVAEYLVDLRTDAVVRSEVEAPARD